MEERKVVNGEEDQPWEWNLRFWELVLRLWRECEFVVGFLEGLVWNLSGSQRWLLWCLVWQRLWGRLGTSNNMMEPWGGRRWRKKEGLFWGKRKKWVFFYRVEVFCLGYFGLINICGLLRMLTIWTQVLFNLNRQIKIVIKLNKCVNLVGSKPWWLREIKKKFFIVYNLLSILA